MAYFTEDFKDADAEVLGYSFGDPKGQQAFESLSLLVATRTWAGLWQDRRFRLNLRSDNIGALTIYSAFKGAAGPMNSIAREFALDMGQGSYEPDLVSHLPGVCNKTADVLSRRNDPRYKKDWTVPSFLSGCQRISPPPRPLSWWKALKAPAW